MSRFTIDEEEERKARVFISYARKDLEFANAITSQLIAYGFDAYLDQKDILPSEPWRDRLAGLIIHSDAVVFVISPDSIVSDVCTWEVDFASKLAKRVVPIVWRRVANDQIPFGLSRLNYIFFDNT